MVAAKASCTFGVLLAQLLACRHFCTAVGQDPSCDPGASTCESRPARRDGGLSLIQVHEAERSKTRAHEEDADMEDALRRRATSTRAASALEAADAICAAHARARRASPEAVAQSLLAGVDAIEAASRLFMHSPPNVTGGLSTLSVRLLLAVEGLIPESTKSSSGFATFRTAWMDAFAQLPATTASIREDLTAFSQTGDAQKLMDAIEAVLVEVTTVVTTFLPQQTAEQLATYIGAVSDVFDGVGAGVVAFAAGDAPGAVESIYKGLRDATNDLVPDSLQGDATYQAVVAVLDSTLGSLSRHVVEFQQQLSNSNVCWRGSVGRDRERPDVCSADYAWDGVQWCLFRATEPLTLESVASGNRYLNNHRGRSQEGNNVQVWNNPGSSHTQWRISGPAGDNSYTIQNVAGGTYLNVAGGSTSNGANLQMSSDASSNSSRWWLHPAGTPGVFTIENVHTGTFVSLPAGSSRGANVRLWDQTAAQDNQWRILYARAQAPFQLRLPGALLETTAAWKTPRGALPAVCAGSLEKHGGWCYGACASGYQADGTRCRAACAGGYPIESSRMCGKTEGSIAAAIAQMVAGTIRQGITVTALIAAMNSSGVGMAAGLTGTMQAIVDLARPFVHPACPV
mmetsp:Transcript_81780/g.243917  ORF Transcript_81780/g.243917 Transcript_81780/m.243917 type:complete len:627 (-) Transcript_81780:52-1932(-)